MAERTEADASAAQPAIQIAQIVLQSATFQHRPDYLTLPRSAGGGNAQIAIDFSFLFAETTDDAGATQKNVVGTLVRVRTEDDDPGVYAFSVEMAVLISAVDNVAPDAVLEWAGVGGLNALYPFLREAVANLTMRGRFGPVWLQPVLVDSFRSEVRELVTRVRAEGVSGGVAPLPKPAPAAARPDDSAADAGPTSVERPSTRVPAPGSGARKRRSTGGRAE